MAPENQHESMSHATPARHEVLVPSHDPGRLVASVEVSNTTSPAPSRVRANPTVKHEIRHDYKPTALRWWFHGALIACLAGVIGLTEYTIQSLQVYDGDDMVSLLWSRDNRDMYQESEETAAATGPSSQINSGTFGNTTSSPCLQQPCLQTDLTATLTGAMTSSGALVVYSSTMTTMPDIAEATAYPDNGRYTNTSTTSPTILSNNQNIYDSGHATILSSPTSPTTKANATATDAGSANLQLSTTIYPHVGGREGMDPDGLDLAADCVVANVCLTKAGCLTWSGCLGVAKCLAAAECPGGDECPKETACLEIDTCLAGTGCLAELVPYDPGNIRGFITPSGGDEVPDRPEHGNGQGVPVQARRDRYLTIGPGPNKRFQRAAFDQAIDHWSENMLSPVATAISQGTAAEKTSSVKVAQEIKAWDPSEARIQQITADFEGPGPFQAGKRTLEGSTGIFQPTTTVPSEGHRRDVTVIQQTQAWSSSRITAQHTTTNADGQSIVRTPEALPKHASVVQSFVSARSGETLAIVPTLMPPVTTTSAPFVLHGKPSLTNEWAGTSTPTFTALANSSSNTSDTNANNKVIGYRLDLKGYILGTFLPTILAVLVAFFVKLISINARLMQPFHTLAKADGVHGATPESSMFLRFDRWFGAISIPLAIKRRQPVIAISDLLVLGAALLAPMAAETVSVHVPDDCQLYCMGTLGVSVTVGRILEALMVTMAALLIALIVLLSGCRWRTGVHQNPWSIAGMASLCLDPVIRQKLQSIPRGLSGRVEDTAILKLLKENSYALGDFCTTSDSGSTTYRGYGMVVAGHGRMSKQLIQREECRNHDAKGSRAGHNRTQPFVLLTWWARCLLIFILSCVLVMLTYYENTYGDTGFERFMESEGFGVNFLFTAIGVVAGGCIETVFRSVAIISPYLQLSSKTLPAEQSILLSPPTNAFYGIYSAIRQRHLFLGVISFTAILGELVLPVTLSHVPFSPMETYDTQLACAWLSIAILALMILVLVASFFKTWPHMPVDPRTVAGAMFYVCDSWMLESLQDLSTMGKKDRDLELRYRRLRYGYGNISGATSGKERMGVDVCDDKGEAALSGSTNSL